MYNITITQVKGYTFKGIISNTELSDKDLETLGLNRDGQSDIEVEGEFVLEWDDDIPMPQIENVYLLGAYNGKTWVQFINVNYCDLVFNGIDTPRKGMETVKSEKIQVPAKYILDLSIDDINYEQVEEQLLNYGNDSDWYADRMSSMIDDAYDRMQD